MTKTKLAIPAVIVLLAAGAGGAQLWAQHDARANLDQTLASLPPGSVGHYSGMSYNLFTQTLRIDGLTITSDGHRVLGIDRTVLHHLSGDGSAATPLKASAVRMDNVTVLRAGHSATAALVQATNVAVLAAGVPPPTRLPNWLIAPGNGTLLSADSLTASGIADDQGATLAAIAITGYHAGHVEQASIGGFADRKGNRIASAAAADIDLDGLDAVFDTGRYTPAAPRGGAPRTLIGQAEIMGFQSQSDDGPARVDSISLEGFAARPFALSPSPENIQTWAFARDAAGAVSLRSASVTGVHFQENPTKAAGGLTALSVSGYADGSLARMALDGLSVKSADRSIVSIGHFEINGLNATTLLRQAAASSAVNLIEAIGQGDVRVAGLALAHLSVTSPNGDTLTLHSVTQTMTGSAPTQFDLKIRGLNMPAGSNRDLAQGLGALGIDDLLVDLDETGSYDIARAEATITRMVLTAHGLGSVSLSTHLTGVPHAMSSEDAMLAAFGSMGIGPFSIHFTNDSLVQRIIAMEARQENKTPQDVTDEAKLAASFVAATLVPDQPDAGEQVAAFIADPKELTITASPTAPVRLGDFFGANLNAAKSALNLRLSAQ
jgi:hypothetical protein